MKRVLLVGEGRNELGGYADKPPYRSDDPSPDVLEALARRAGCQFEVVDAIQWKDIRKYRAGDHASPEERNLKGARLEAKERDCHAVLFSRDRDRDRDRARQIDALVDSDPACFAGGVAVEAIESWILSFLGDAGAEGYRRPKKQLEEDHGISTTEEMVEVI